VDPLDGTKEFIKRNGEFTVNIALMHPLPASPGGGGGMHPIPDPSPVGKGMPSADARYTVLDARKYGRLKEFARDMRKEPTAAEAAMWRMLRHDNLEVRFRRQHILDEFIVDFVCLKKRLVVEIDGDVHKETVEADALRTERLETLGFRVMRFTNHEVLADEAKVFDCIRDEVAKRPTFTASMDYEQFPNGVGDLHSSLPTGEGWGGVVTALGTHSPIAGVLYVPVSDTLYFAWNGGGSYRIAQAKTFNTTSAYELAARAERLPMPRTDKTFTIVASRSHASLDTDAYIARKEQEHGTVKLTSMGSALKICLVAEGTADAYPRYAPTMEWDTAAGHAIANEAGNQLIDVTTNAPMRYNKASLVNNWFIVQ
jgi:3'-phosphoadenosine 5'-phosphosulfate (PAPS) 3'-phosphatase